MKEHIDECHEISLGIIIIFNIKAPYYTTLDAKALTAYVFARVAPVQHTYTVNRCSRI